VFLAEPLTEAWNEAWSVLRPVLQYRSSASVCLCFVFGLVLTLGLGLRLAKPRTKAYRSTSICRNSASVRASIHFYPCFGSCFGTIRSVLRFRVRVNDKRLHHYDTVTRPKVASLTPVCLLHSLTSKVADLMIMDQHTVPMIDTICGFAL